MQPFKKGGNRRRTFKSREILAHARLPRMTPINAFLELGISLTPAIVSSLARLIKENRFLIISSQQD